MTISKNRSTISKKTQHATLKRYWGIAQAERHSTISKCPKWTCESSFFLVLRSNGNLIIPRVTVQETVILVARQTFKYLINEGKWEMVLTSCGNKLPIVNANSIFVGSRVWTNSLFSFSTTVKPDFLGTAWIGLTHWLSEMG